MPCSSHPIGACARYRPHRSEKLKKQGGRVLASVPGPTSQRKLTSQAVGTRPLPAARASGAPAGLLLVRCGSALRTGATSRIPPDSPFYSLPLQAAAVWSVCHFLLFTQRCFNSIGSHAAPPHCHREGLPVHGSRLLGWLRLASVLALALPLPASPASKAEYCQAAVLVLAIPVEQPLECFYGGATTYPFARMSSPLPTIPARLSRSLGAKVVVASLLLAIRPFARFHAQRFGKSAMRRRQCLQGCLTLYPVNVQPPSRFPVP